jgi:hypothetical protein
MQTILHEKNSKAVEITTEDIRPYSFNVLVRGKLFNTIFGLAV